MATKEKMSAVFDLRGLDLVTPVDLISNGRTPYAKNFRLYAQQTDDRRVAVSSRKGPGFYISPLGETLADSNTSSTGASTADVGPILGVHAQPQVASTTGRITRVDIKAANLNQGTGPLMVQIYSDSDGAPYQLLSESSLANGDFSGTAAYITARFLKAPLVTSGDTYWIVLRGQDDAKNTYTISTTTAGTKAYKTDSNFQQLVLQTYALNYKVYFTTPGVDKGSYRFNRDNGNNITLAAYGTTMYTVDESTHALSPLITGLSSDATEYRFANGDNKVFWVNGEDNLTAWNGLLPADQVNVISNGTFEVNTTGWSAAGGGTGNALARTTSEHHTGVASLNVTATAGANVRSARQALVLSKNHLYRFSYWVKGAAASSTSDVYLNGPNATAKSTALTTSWQQVTFYYYPTADTTSIDFRSPATDFYIDDIEVYDTGIEYIIDSELPILSDVIMHKDRLWGVDANDPNKLVFSEAPGNPSDAPTNAQWYRAWLSVSFIYVPRPHNGSPITGLVSFQDSLTVFTQDNKYVISGYDRGSFNLREATGKKGALSRRGVISEENFIFFVGNDGLYSYNGSKDTKISKLINPLFDSCGQKDEITPVIWNNQVRFYLASNGSSVNDTCVIYDKDLDEIEYDTSTYVNRALYYGDADDDGKLVEFSSLVPVAYNAEQDYNSLGAPIDFEYRFKYDSMGLPAQKKRIKRFFPLIPGVDSEFTVRLAMDRDMEDSPRFYDMDLKVGGARIGEFNLGDGTVFGGDTTYKVHRISISGYGYYWQLRVIRKGVNNRIAIVGSQYSYKAKRL